MLERIEQRKPAKTFQHTVYHEVPREAHIYGQRPVSAMGYPSGTNYRDNHVSTYPVMYNNQAHSQLSEENRRLKARVHDLQSRVDHLLRGQNDIEAGSKTMNTIWDEMVTQLCELFGASIEDKEDKVAATTVVLSRAREIKSEMIELQAQNAQVVKQKTTYFDHFQLQTVVDRSGSSADSAQETIARMAAQISDSQTSSNDQKSEIADLNKHLIEAAAEKDRLEAEVAYLKVRIFKEFLSKKLSVPPRFCKCGLGSCKRRNWWSSRGERRTQNRSCRIDSCEKSA